MQWASCRQDFSTAFRTADNTSSLPGKLSWKLACWKSAPLHLVVWSCGLAAREWFSMCPLQLCQNEELNPQATVPNLGFPRPLPHESSSAARRWTWRKERAVHQQCKLPHPLSPLRPRRQETSCKLCERPACQNPNQHAYHISLMGNWVHNMVQYVALGSYMQNT